jgi:hypothetical protein
VAEFNQFGNNQPSRSPDPAHCAQCEILLTDAFDRTLSKDEQSLFDRHLAICPDCSRMFIDARTGADLLQKLKVSPPEPSPTLLERILATTGPATEVRASVPSRQNTLGLLTPVPAANGAISGSGPEVVYASGKVLPFRQRVVNAFKVSSVRHTLMQPRLAMTAAMAFFSIALTMNLTGVQITNLRASDFTPSSLKRTFYDTNARVVRSVNNLRVVYELESRVRDLQRDSDNSSTPPQTSTPAPVQNPPSDQQKNDQKDQDQQKRPNPRPRSGSSRSLRLNPSQVITASLTEPGFPPQSGPEQRQVFVIFTPTALNPIEQGGHA